MNGFEFLLNELESQQLQVCLAPATEPKHEGHQVRVVMERNPPWYRRLCESFPSSRAGRIRTRVKRQHILRLLDRLAAGERLDSQYVPNLERYAAEKAGEFIDYDERNPF
ncbi:hypothetical protein [Coraliomargarita parva]|uniref:hypothetical protein n=1 Tax=Coraliomargarita parva TaxID=3014050 RepID=UPI0022B44339|nr:hypothetical protein [Coraliomargarita parva]